MNARNFSNFFVNLRNFEINNKELENLKSSAVNCLAFWEFIKFCLFAGFVISLIYGFKYF